MNVFKAKIYELFLALFMSDLWIVLLRQWTHSLYDDMFHILSVYYRLWTFYSWASTDRMHADQADIIYLFLSYWDLEGTHLI